MFKLLQWLFAWLGRRTGLSPKDLTKEDEAQHDKTSLEQAEQRLKANLEGFEKMTDEEKVRR